MSCDQKEMMREKELLRKEQELRAYEARLESNNKAMSSSFENKLTICEIDPMWEDFGKIDFSISLYQQTTNGI